MAAAEAAARQRLQLRRGELPHPPPLVPRPPLCRAPFPDVPRVLERSINREVATNIGVGCGGSSGGKAGSCRHMAGFHCSVEAAPAACRGRLSGVFRRQQLRRTARRLGVSFRNGWGQGIKERNEGMTALAGKRGRGASVGVNSPRLFVLRSRFQGMLIRASVRRAARQAIGGDDRGASKGGSGGPRLRGGRWWVGGRDATGAEVRPIRRGRNHRRIQGGGEMRATQGS